MVRKVEWSCTGRERVGHLRPATAISGNQYELAGIRNGRLRGSGQHRFSVFARTPAAIRQRIIVAGRPHAGELVGVARN